MDFIIVTGLSGGGKSKAICAFEDIGFYCVDNIPPSLIPTFYNLCCDSKDKNIKKVAVVVDVRGGEKFSVFFESLGKLKVDKKPYRILFIEAKEHVITRRYKETRRKHPLYENYKGSVSQAIELEKNVLKTVRERSDYIIDTSFLSDAQLKERICMLFLKNSQNSLMINCMSFGFKYGSPSEADLVFDVRCFPNPHYEENLKNLTGLDEPVRLYVLKKQNTKIFIEKLFSLIDFMLPLYHNEGKSQLVIAIGCTGGKHRSVAITQRLYEHLSDSEHNVNVCHRDIKKVFA
ncbi:MAG: RNase adapter RapZ [Oscillospiraceae bacterium]|nr:RNase adapter RapZ [Oscillospiraceae bacterium]